MKTPTDIHPHEGTQRALQNYDRNLWLVWIRHKQRWAVLYEAPVAGLTPYHLRKAGLVNSKYSHWQIAKMCWDRKGRYVCPTFYRNLILASVRGNDAQVHGLLNERQDELDRKEDARKELIHAKVRERNKEIARDVWKTTGVNKTMTIGLDQRYGFDLRKTKAIR